MTVLIVDPRSAERIGRAALLIALDNLTVSEYSLEPGSEPGNPHYHAQHVDVHAFPIAIGSRARILNLHTPGVGFERYLRELTAMRSRGEQPDADFLGSHDIYEV